MPDPHRPNPPHNNARNVVGSKGAVVVKIIVLTQQATLIEPVTTAVGTDATVERKTVTKVTTTTTIATYQDRVSIAATTI